MPSVPVVPPDVLASWRSRLAALRADAARTAKLREIALAREAANAGLAELIARYLQGKIDLAKLKTVFDQKTRGEWSSLGASGPNGGMVVNQIAAQAGAFPAIEAAWRALLPAPTDSAAADASIASMNAALDAARDASDTPLKIPHSGRTPSIASVMWAAQNEAWPPYFNSIARALVRDALYDGEGYGAYRAALFALRERLGATTLEVEELALSVGEDAFAAAPAPEPVQKPRRIWLIAPGEGAMYWDKWRAEGVMTIGWDDVTDLTKYASEAAVLAKLRETRKDRNPRGAARTCWQFGHAMAPGDIVYAKKGRWKILGRGVVTSDYRHDPKNYDHHIRSVRWESAGEWKTSGMLAMGTLTEIGKSPQLVKELGDLVGPSPGAEDVEDDAVGVAAAEAYTLDDATKELFMARDTLEEVLDLWRHKKNLILQGPPGVGKTFVASRLAQLLIESADEERICRVQFHPSYAYEDFVQGLRPTTTGGFERHDGPLLRFCKLALQDQENDFVLIIDEINRGNVSKILGELLSLLEADKRDPKYSVALAYSHAGEPRFHVPPNLFVIGMMNTADRALSLVDYALRRRFVFTDLVPAFGREELRTWWRALGLDGPLRSRIEQRLSDLNQGIANDAALGPGYAIGHSYFCQKSTGYDDAWFERILRYEIEPLLREYWFDTPAKVEAAMSALRA